MKLLIDAQLPPSLAAWLRDRGHQAEHVHDLGLSGATDNAIWLLALEMSAVLVSKDRDFADWALTRTPAPVVVWVRSGNMSAAAQQERFLLAWSKALVQLVGGERLVEIR